MTDQTLAPPSLNRLALAVVVLAAIVAAGALFVLPALRAAGMSFIAAFLLVSAIEFVTAVVGGYAALRIYESRED